MKMIQYEGEKKYKAWVDPDRCMGCGCCAVNCKGDACTMICVRPPEFIEAADRPSAGRYDAPEKYRNILSQSTVARRRQRKIEQSMEEGYCFEHGINRDPYNVKR